MNIEDETSNPTKVVLSYPRSAFASSLCGFVITPVVYMKHMS